MSYSSYVKTTDSLEQGIPFPALPSSPSVSQVPSAEAINPFICSEGSCLAVRKEQKSHKDYQKAGLWALGFPIWEDSTCLRWRGHFMCYMT